VLQTETSGKPKLLLCIPSYSGVAPLPFFHFLDLHKEIARAELSGDYRCYTTVIGPRSPIRGARNEAAEAAITGGASHLLFIDDDMLVPANIVSVLLGLKKDIVSPLFYRSGPAPCVFRENGSEELETWLDHPTDAPFECAAVGTGCMLIEVRVLRALDAPRFYYERTHYSMDVNFCRDARAAGFEVWCDPRLRVKQLRADPELL
jgi:hypothetical protein